MKKYWFTVCLMFIFFSCEDDETDCSTVLCAGPPNLVFEVLMDGENVFDTATFSQEDVSLTGPTPTSFDIQVNETNYGNTRTQLLVIERIDWEVDTYSFDLNIGDANSFNLAITIELSTGACCGGIPRIASYRIDGVNQENPNLVATLNLN